MITLILGQTDRRVVNENHKFDLIQGEYLQLINTEKYRDTFYLFLHKKIIISGPFTLFCRESSGYINKNKKTGTINGEFHIIYNRHNRVTH